MLRVDGLAVTRIARDDVSALAELQNLLERCSDYYQLHEGEPARLTAATDEFDHVPPEIPRDNLFILGFHDSEELIAEMSLVRDYPKPGEWWIALFVVDPRVRSRGYGRRICNAIFEWLAGSTMLLAVDEENPRGDAFWRSLGFAETRRSDYTAPTGSKRRVVIMKRSMPSSTSYSHSIVLGGFEEMS
jgi:ribosomal protein S18 acetylase RimI-like enzyme